PAELDGDAISSNRPKIALPMATVARILRHAIASSNSAAIVRAYFVGSFRMAATRFDVLGIGNAIVDVIARTDDAFLAKQKMRKGTMRLIDEAQAAGLYDAMGPAVWVSGGSAAETIVGAARLGARARPSSARSRTTSSAAFLPTTSAPRAWRLRRRRLRLALPPRAATCWSRPTASAP